MGAALVLLLVALGAMAAGVLIGRYYVPDDRQLRRTARHSRAYMRALSQLIARDHEAVMAELRAVVEENVEDAEPYFALGALFRSRGEHERAIRVHQALAVRERDRRKLRHRAMYELGLDFRAAGMPRRATRAMEKVLTEEPAHEGALRALAGLYEEQARFHEAAGMWQRLGRRRGADLGHREHHLLVAAAQAAVGRADLDSAKQLLKMAHKHEESAHFFAAAAELAAARGNHRGAKERLKQALTAEPGLVPHLLPGLIAAEQALAAQERTGHKRHDARDDDDLQDEPAAAPALAAATRAALPAATGGADTGTPRDPAQPHARNGASAPGGGMQGTAMTAAAAGSGADGVIGAAGGVASPAQLGDGAGASGSGVASPAQLGGGAGTGGSGVVSPVPHAVGAGTGAGGVASPAQLGAGAGASGGGVASPAQLGGGAGTGGSGVVSPVPHAVGAAAVHAAGGAGAASTSIMPALVGVAAGALTVMPPGELVAPEPEAPRPIEGVPLVPEHRPAATIAERVLAVLAEIEAQSGPRLELALIRAQLVPPADAAGQAAVVGELEARFPDALAARVAAARLAIARGEDAAIRGALDRLVADQGALAWALRGRWQCAHCGHRPGPFSWRCAQCRRWSTLRMETGIEPPPVPPRERRAAPRAARVDGLLAAADPGLPGPTLDAGLSEAELASAGSRPSLLGRVGGWFSDLWRRDAS